MPRDESGRFAKPEPTDNPEIFHCALCDYEGPENKVVGHIAGKHRRKMHIIIRHGSNNGYQQHIRRKIPPCPACKAAHKLYNRGVSATMLGY